MRTVQQAARQGVLARNVESMGSAVGSASVFVMTCGAGVLVTQAPGAAGSPLAAAGECAGAEGNARCRVRRVSNCCLCGCCWMAGGAGV